MEVSEGEQDIPAAATAGASTGSGGAEQAAGGGGGAEAPPELVGGAKMKSGRKSGGPRPRCSPNPEAQGPRR